MDTLKDGRGPRIDFPWPMVWRHRGLRLVVLLLLLLGSGAWWSMELAFRVHRDSLLEQARQRAKARAGSYNHQLERITNRFEQVGDHVIERRDTGRALAWDTLVVGVVPRPDHFYAAVFDAQGKLLEASFRPRMSSIASLDFFKEHRNGCCDDWLISPPEFGPTVGATVVRFSKRLVDRHGQFAGVFVMAVLPDYLRNFHHEEEAGPHDFVALHLSDGRLVATKLGGNQPSRSVYLDNPGFAGAEGVRHEPADVFNDGAARIVAWHRHASLPFVAVAAVSEADVLAEFEQRVAQLRTIGAAFVVLFLVAVGFALLAAVRRQQRRQAESEVRRVYRAATDAANEGFFMLRPLLDAEGRLLDVRIDDCNERAGQLLGSERQILVGEKASSVLRKPVLADLLDVAGRALAFGDFEDERRVPAREKLPAKWLHRRAISINGDIALTMRDISESKAHEEELQALAHRDALTGLPNRQWFQGFLPGALKRARRGHLQCALMFIDLDHFKSVNDSLGHEAGDQLLQDVAAHLREAVRASDHVVRLGGDEFVIIIEHLEDASAADSLADKIIGRLRTALEPGGGPRSRVNASIGVTIYPQDGEDSETLIKNADIAMYAAKAAGRGRYRRYRPEFSAALNERLVLEEALRGALERREWVMHYQPKIYARSGKLRGFEALLRWNHPQRGLLTPCEFMPIAEEMGLAGRLGEQVIELVVQQMAAWRRAGLPSLRMAINVSPAQLKNGDLAAFLQRTLAAHVVEATCLDIEITEVAMVDDSEATKWQLAQLRALGVRLIIDDFGAGYSSLSRLQQLQVDGLKIDKGFSGTLSRGSSTEALYRATIWMASAFDLEVVAEGVETVEQLQVLLDIGCNAVQGNLMSPALPADEAARFAHQRQASPFDWQTLPLLALVEPLDIATQSPTA